ncbi:recombinase RecT, partial [Candidatus Pacearchaeota archaeon]|nr:recombinase RecT [Candidatus Pacearchaeota archaeon]
MATTNKMTKPTSTIELVGILQSDSFKRQVMMALPKHLDPDRFLRIALTEFRKNPELATCNQKSFLGAIVQCSQLGLEPGDNLGRAYLLPYNNRKQNTKDCQLIIGYRGLLDLARRSGEIASISAHCVYENDKFVFEYGLEEKLQHCPARGDRGKFVATFALAKFKDGGYQFEVMFQTAI